MNVQGVDLNLSNWRRASKCINSGCVEVRRVGDDVDVRDAKVAGGPVLTYTPEEWRVFIAAVKAGEYDDFGA